MELAQQLNLPIRADGMAGDGSIIPNMLKLPTYTCSGCAGFAESMQIALPQYGIHQSRWKQETCREGLRDPRG